MLNIYAGIIKFWGSHENWNENGTQSPPYACQFGGPHFYQILDSVSITGDELDSTV